MDSILALLLYYQNMKRMKIKLFVTFLIILTTLNLGLAQDTLHKKLTAPKVTINKLSKNNTMAGSTKQPEKNAAIKVVKQELQKAVVKTKTTVKVSKIQDKTRITTVKTAIKNNTNNTTPKATKNLENTKKKTATLNKIPASKTAAKVNTTTHKKAQAKATSKTKMVSKTKETQKISEVKTQTASKVQALSEVKTVQEQALELQKLAEQTIQINNTVAPATCTDTPAPQPAKQTPQIPVIATQPPTGFIYQVATYKINAIDPTAETASTTYYPGLRGTNQLIVYTPQYGVKTGTNEFGTEAIVSGNTVIDVNGADSIIPKDGFVISGHGTAKKWINENVSVGSKITIDADKNILKTYLVPESFIFAAKEKIKDANSIMEYYRGIDILYDDKAPLTYIMKAKELLRKAEKDPDNAQIYISEAVGNANSAIKNALPYRADELKGVWIRPTEKTPEEIIKAVEKLSDIGINNIFLETYYHGKTIYPSEVLQKYNVTNQYEDFMGFDPLKIWIEECHKRNIKVNIWFETFYVGNKNPNCNPKHVLSMYPEWANTTKIGYASTTPVASLSEHNGYFLDPANPDVQKYLLEILNEIITKYCPDGINLDYIRYPQSLSPKFSSYDMSNWGYTAYARNDFKCQFGVDPIEIKYGTDMWDIWAKYRQNKVTDFVEQTRKLTYQSNIALTAVIFPDRQRSLDIKMQDWRTWSLNNYIDGFTPLILTSDRTTAASMINDIKSNSSIRTKIYPGLFVTFMGGTFDDLLKQIQEGREQNTNGAIIFDYAHLSQDYIDALKVRVYNPASNQQAEGINRHSQNYYQSQKKRRFFWR